MLDDLLTWAANGVPTITVTLTRGNRESLNLEQRTLTLDEFYTRLSEHPVVSDKNTAEAVIPGIVGSCSTPCRNHDRAKAVDCGGGKPHRLMENIREIHALFIDLDGWSQDDVEAYCSQARDAGLEFFAYSSYSYAPPDHANARVVLPLDAPITVGDARHWRRNIWSTLVRRAGLNPESIDAQCSDASRLYYLPCRRAADAPVWTAGARGQRLSTLDLPAAPARTISIVTQSPAAIADIRRDAFWLALRAEAYGLGDLSLIARAQAGQDISIDGQRHAGILALTRLMALAYPGNDWETLEAFVVPCLEALGDERDFIAEAERAFEGAKHNILRNEPVDSASVDFKALLEERRGLDTGLARRFARTTQGVRKLSGSKDTWLIRNGARWELDASGLVIEHAKRVASTFEADRAEVKAEFDTLSAQQPEIQALATSGLQDVRPTVERFQNKLAALENLLTKTIPRTMDTASSKAAMDRFTALAGTEPGMRVEPDALDSIPWLLNTQSGAVDLRTGQLTAVPDGAYLTKVTPVAYRPDAQAPTFLAALNAALPDPEVRGLFQRSVGYAITGSIKEQKFFLLVGDGGNGKSTLLVAVLRALGVKPGGYAGTTPKSAVVDSHAFSAKEHQTADLRGLRMVQVMELSSRERLASDRIKQVTGGDFTTAARKYENQITFMAQCKLFMPCNVMPMVSDQDHGTWRRLVVIPFTQRLDGTGGTLWNADIQEQLDSEGEGILAWAVQGAVEWYRNGLQIPAQCAKLVEEYREGEDAFIQFIKERVSLQPIGSEDRVSGREMFQTYCAWCDDSRLKACSAKSFTQQLRRALGKYRPGMEQTRHTEHGLTWLYVRIRKAEF